MKTLLALLLLIPSLSFAKVTLTCSKNPNDFNESLIVTSIWTLDFSNEILTNLKVIASDGSIFEGENIINNTSKIFYFDDEIIKASEVIDSGEIVEWNLNLRTMVLANLTYPHSFVCKSNGDINIPNTNNENIFVGNDELIPVASGSGFFINLYGDIVTNFHVIEDCDTNYAFYFGKKYNLTTLGIDRVNDLAILRSDVSPKKFLKIGAEEISLLEDVIIAGYPLGKEVSSSIKTTKGSITSLSGYGDNYSMFQTDAALNEGNSGGPIVDRAGNVVGVAVSMYGKDLGVESFNFGIKSSILRVFMNSLDVDYRLANYQKKNNKELGELVSQSTIYLECWMKESKYNKIISEQNTYKAFYKK